MGSKQADTGILLSIQFLASVCFMISLVGVLGYLLLFDDWTALAWYPVAMIVYFPVQVLAWVAVTGRNFRRKHIYSMALAPLVVALGCVVGSGVSFFFLL
ncbi:hypothetical protein [Brevundimonas sp.]|uniref:hypothetical protein n=1 Tax=Brevundimonas sp. TaxID=1871086 RepID=UPI00289EA58D|nr:hypothetical protein [Brevundimonas sp.]